MTLAPRPRTRRTRIAGPSSIGIPAEHVGWREPCELKIRFQDAVENILYWATIRGTKVGFYKFSTRTFGDKQAATRDLKRRWHLFQQRGLWRRIEIAIWVFSDIGRPHLHLVAELPPGISMTALRDAWSGGYTHGQLVRSSVRLGAYLAAQWRDHGGKRPEPQRYWGEKRRERQCLACTPATRPSSPSPPTPLAPHWKR